MRVALSPAQLSERRERVFLVLAAIFLCAMTLLNVVGISRFIQLGPLALAVGVLPYPITFLCTDLICELYGRRRANFLVTVGLCLNVFILGCLYLGQLLPSVDPATQPPWQVINLASDIVLPSGEVVGGSIELFQLIYSLTTGAVFASMMAYLAAQYVDVQLFHFWKRLTKGKHLWLRNNLSTLFSQLVDATMVISVTFGATYLAGGITLNQMLVLIGSNYLFKMIVALMDTGPLYLGVHWLRKYLQVPHPVTVDEVLQDQPAS
ncbi:MAG: queuosine precursor transporter [Lysobacterales bacterium]